MGRAAVLMGLLSYSFVTVTLLADSAGADTPIARAWRSGAVGEC